MKLSTLKTRLKNKNVKTTLVNNELCFTIKEYNYKAFMFYDILNIAIDGEYHNVNKAINQKQLLNSL